MPPVGGKGKSKGGTFRRSRSRNTTPSSVGATTINTSAGNGSTTAFLELPLSQLMVPSNINYDDILERHGSASGIPDPKHLETLAADLRTLASLAEARGQLCDTGMRELSKRRKERLEDEREKERQDREAEAKQDALKREAAAREEETERELSRGKNRKAKEQLKARPLTHGAHGLARQDGLDTEMRVPQPDHLVSVMAGKRRKGGRQQRAWIHPSVPGELDRLNENLIIDTPRRRTKRFNVTEASSSPEPDGFRRGATTPDKVKHETSTSISSLSPSSQPPTPPAATAQREGTSEPSSPASSSSLSEHQPPPAAAVPQYQTFGADPLTFDDPTIYHIRDVEPGMSDDEIKEIYSVADYPHDDLHDLIPGTPPDKDFSNAKPSNQVAANTFATYIEPYFRPFTDEDLAFLRERGDRSTAFVIPRRGKRNYSEVWAEEDGAMSIDSPMQSSNKPSANQARGSIEQMNDDVAESDQVSSGPLLSRLLAAMRVEHRPSNTEEKPTTNGMVNGEASTNGVMGETHGEVEVNGDAEKPVPPATFIPDSTQPGWKIPTTKLDYAQVDERLKQELRYIGFLSDDAEPDYDAHYDDEIAARLRYLQAELKEQSILNGARKARIAELAKTRLAHQEYNTILEDLDNQVQSAYLKRNRTLGKGKKQQKRPGGAGGGSHFVSGGGGGGVSRPGIGDVTRTLMERRKRWIDSIGPVFEEGLGRVPKATVFEADVMAGLVEKEREGWDEGDE
ncbi:MAG: Transcriptional regulator [Caeruleum heppii]|nr:MAG: Transcriptional regulator [Caeruleum heppii]